MIELKAIGIVGNDPILHDIKGLAYVGFSLACKKKHDESPVWIQVETKLQIMLSYLKKGTKVYVSGMPVFKAYTKKSTGEPTFNVNLYTNEIEIVSVLSKTDYDKCDLNE